jgi:transposase
VTTNKAEKPTKTVPSERSGGEQREPERSGEALRPQHGAGADPEVVPKAKRRVFTVDEKLRILREADACSEGEHGALLRREGIYSSYLSHWRREFEDSGRAGLLARKRGRKAKVDPMAQRIAELEMDNRLLEAQLDRAKAVIEIQKKLSILLGIPLTQTNGGDS